jgi:uncharacterized membrane protein
MDPKIIAAALLVATLCSIALAVYFLLIYFRRIPANARFVPTFCHIEEGTCGAAVFSRYGRLFFGIPNSAFGLGYYLVVLGLAVQTLIAGPPAWLGFLLLPAVGTLGVSAYLIWAMRARLGVT